MKRPVKLDLSDFENPLELRRCRLDDYDAIVDLQQRCFPDMDPWTREEFRSQLQIFPEGQICIEYEGHLIASAASLIIDDDDYAQLHDWESVSDNGMIRNHDPEGDTLYGIEIQVDPAYRGRRLSRRLYEARKELVRELGLARIAIGGRIPGYGAHKDELSAREYVEAVMDKRLVDPVLTAQLSNGFVLRELIPDYLSSDEDSAGYATHLEWSNLEYVPKRRTARRATRPVRAGIVQYQMRDLKSWEDFERQVEFFVDTGADYQADVLLFPELFTLQLLTLVEGRPAQAARQLAEFTPKYLELFTDLAVRYNVNIIGGSQFTVEGDDLYNIAYLFRRDGTIGQQKKIHVTPSEARWWGVKGGDSVEVFETDIGPIGLVICYDVEFPELVRVVADKGARILFVPYNTNDRYGHLRVRTCAQARCIENHMFVVTAGCVGNLPFVENADIHFAQSGFYTPSDIDFPWNQVAAEASPNIETVLVSVLDTELVRRHKLSGTTQNWQDRRTDLYGVSWRGQGGPREI